MKRYKIYNARKGSYVKVDTSNGYSRLVNCSREDADIVVESDLISLKGIEDIYLYPKDWKAVPVPTNMIESMASSLYYVIEEAAANDYYG